MAKIVSRRPLGQQPVYDIGVARDHNFVLADGSVASNCFNKSHSTAYAYITYQTAYLKANYPVEYMAALLSANSDSTDKIERYIETCQRMAIAVEPPDINRSQVSFTPVGDAILFGLSAVRNVGHSAIENILAAREQAGGAFQSLADLCARVDLQTVNRRALESLIYCGALDCLGSNRNQLICSLEPMLKWAQGRARARNSGQFSLFEADASSSETDGFADAPVLENVADFSPADKLKQEKDLLGFYVSDHPLKATRQAARVFAPVSLGELGGYEAKQAVSALALVAEAKPVTTKKGDRMAFVTLEDLSGQAEGVVFPDAYERIGSLLEADARLIVWGKVDWRNEQPQLLVDDAETVERVRMVVVDLTPQQAADRQALRRLQDTLQSQSGERAPARVPVVGAIGDGSRQQFVRFGPRYWVPDDGEAVERLNAMGFSARAAALMGQR
ncbi:MAG: trans-splicing intein-formed DNA polymerase III subunit alpha C-terminal partner DnaE-C [Cyanobacteria bacterium QS_8_64_29]|nr:MAG: trans-splicing intein-formed DNA polymerase III subunit alpha C-terminal partner DnaE-C [Cyanobacteria bacterium QS_8_64_29]